MIEVGAISPSLEDYVERIFELLKEHGFARVSDIAKRKSVRKASVNEAVTRLEEKGLVSHDRYGTVSLTKTGAKLANALEKRHAVLQRFLSEIIQVPRDIADQDACTIEHHVHPKTVSGLVRFFDFVDNCPEKGSSWLKQFHDCCQVQEKKTPCSSCDAEKAPLTLKNAKPNTKYRIAAIHGGGATRKRLLDMGIGKGNAIAVKRIAPLGDPIDIEIKGYHLSLRKSEAATIEVEED